DPSFNPNDPTQIKRAGQVDPRAAMAMQTNALRGAETNAYISSQAAIAKDRNEKAQQKQREDFLALMLPIGRATLSRYNDAVRRGIPADQAEKDAQAFYDEQLGDLEKSGQAPEAMLSHSKNAKFNPYSFQVRIAQAESMLGIKPEAKAPQTKEFKEGSK